MGCSPVSVAAIHVVRLAGGLQANALGQKRPRWVNRVDFAMSA
jgi:hypothetical protein